MVRDAEEFHDALLSLGWVPCARMPGWDVLVPKLAAAGRVATLWQGETKLGWLAAEYRHYAGLLFPDARIDPATGPVDPTEQVEQEEVLNRVVLGWMESIGPTTAGELSQTLHLSE